MEMKAKSFLGLLLILALALGLIPGMTMTAAAEPDVAGPGGNRRPDRKQNQKIGNTGNDPFRSLKEKQP